MAKTIFRGFEVGDGELFVNWGFLQNYQLSERSNHQISCMVCKNTPRIQKCIPGCFTFDFIERLFLA